MVFRYRLKDTTQNKEIQQKKVNNFLIKKNEWLYSAYRLGIHIMSDVIEEQADSMEDFKNKDQDLRKNNQIEKRELGKMQIHNKIESKPIREPILNTEKLEKEETIKNIVDDTVVESIQQKDSIIDSKPVVNEIDEKSIEAVTISPITNNNIFNINQFTIEQLQEECKKRNFLEDEYKFLNKTQLINMILLDIELESDCNVE